ncbi:ABC transporter ATP-binding protein [Arenicella xantha]|uniref:ABC-type polysaccharide/polyol phosphate transport system ATPase subunit n=1 Tax=Arenicella xantha TaxID=644221 RepID=A0A395JNA6_9GAMM|nr:ABC transporter ATP-binding protein [Arenicella xantha]RBP52957.1 ABC-type polysaccharide/polyol phosphate transport system ATPase subunit [Arenicella xantha]
MSKDKAVILEVDSIGKMYWRTDPVSGKKNQFWPLKDVSFSMQKGCCIGLTGSNGAGKSTLLKIISGITTPTLGHVNVDGKIAPLLGLGAGFHEELTGKDNIFVYGALIGIKHQELKLQFDAIVDFAEIGAFIGNKVKNYSTGMKVRLAFSIVSSVRPDLILADEILAVGDESFRCRIMQRMLELKLNGTSILLVQHDTSIIETICDKVVKLEGGRLQSSY